MPGQADEPPPTDLLGSWHMERRLVDRLAGQYGHVTGTLELRLVESEVHWREIGQLVWDGRVIEVTRELHVVQSDGEWLVCFSDGRLFHSWRPGAVVDHPCDEDVYRGLIGVDRARTRLRVLWDVIGPKKEQRIFTRCVRMDGSAKPV